ncbi:hypothetical protein BC829DRAFT_168490 [Chytridium lagenaria]|nr:hypothetical protein BC829DRAFT_168490 [Chytridium lagenaria]
MNSPLTTNHNRIQNSIMDYIIFRLQSPLTLIPKQHILQLQPNTRPCLFIIQSPHVIPHIHRPITKSKHKGSIHTQRVFHKPHSTGGVIHVLDDVAGTGEWKPVFEAIQELMERMIWREVSGNSCLRTLRVTAVISVRLREALSDMRRGVGRVMERWAVRVVDGTDGREREVLRREDWSEGCSMEVEEALMVLSEVGLRPGRSISSEIESIVPVLRNRFLVSRRCGRAKFRTA